MKIASTTATTLFAATALLAAIAMPNVHAACATQNYGRCGSKNDGVSCCPDTFYCQPWDPGYYQCMPQPAKCSKQRTNVDYLGNDLQTLYSIQPDECCKRCSETPGCAGYTFINSRPGPPACYLKSAIGKETKLIGAVSGIVNKPKAKPKSYKNTKGHKNNKSGGNNQANCGTPKYNGCGNSNWASCCPTGQYCQPWSPQYYQCMDAPNGCPSQLTDTDYAGNDLMKLPLGSPGQCCDACKKDSRCKAYTFINYDNNGPACYLKSAAGNAKTKKGAVSGKKVVRSLPCAVDSAAMARRQRGSSNASFDEFFSAFSKSVRADVRLENSEIVVSHSGDLLNEALVSTGGVATHSNPNSRPTTRSSPVGKTSASLPRLNPRSPVKPTATTPAIIQEVQLPTHLTALTALQASDGSWRFNDKFQYVIQEVASPPPDGISPKLWATAVVLTILRQFPEYFAQLEPAYDKAMLHVDENVLRAAKTHVDITPEAMERIRPYQNNEAKLIRERLAREAAAKRAEEDAEERRFALERQKIVTISKYSMFKAKRLPIETQELMVSTLMSEVQAIFPDKSKPPKQMRPAEMEIRAGEAVECCWRRVDGSKRPKVHSQWWLCLVTAVHTDGKTINVHYLVDPYEREQNVRLKHVRLTEDDAQNRRAAALESLKQTWEEPLPLNNELVRLHEVDEKCKWRKPWEIRSLPSLPACQTSETEHIRPRSSVSTRSRLTAAALEAIDKRQQEADLVLEGMYQQAVEAALAYDKVYAQIRPVFKKAIKCYASAILFSERFHAFDQFLDVAVQLVTHTMTTLERIEAWTSHGSSSTKLSLPSTTRIARMFVWGGHDFIVTLLRSLDFVGSRQPAVEWYGEDFAFSLNPFLMAESIRDLVQDRGLAFTEKFTPIESENGLRVALRMHKEEDQGGTSTRDMPTWWPQARYDADLLTRIKKAENFVIDYLRVVDILR